MIKNGYYISNTLSSLVTLIILLYSNHQLEAGKNNEHLKKWLLTLITFGTIILAVNIGILSCKLNCGMDIETGYPILVIFLLIQLMYIVMILGIIYLFTQSENTKNKPIGVLSIGLVLYMTLLGTTIYKLYSKRDRKSAEQKKKEKRDKLSSDLAKKIEEQKANRELKRQQELYEQLSREDIDYNQAEIMLREQQRPERHLVLSQAEPEVIEEQGTVMPRRRTGFTSRVGFIPGAKKYRQTPMPTSTVPGFGAYSLDNTVPVVYRSSMKKPRFSIKRRRTGDRD